MSLRVSISKLQPIFLLTLCPRIHMLAESSFNAESTGVSHARHKHMVQVQLTFKKSNVWLGLV